MPVGDQDTLEIPVKPIEIPDRLSSIGSSNSNDSSDSQATTANAP